MLKMKRKLLSLLMTAAMISTLFAGLTISSFADTAVTEISSLSQITDMSGNYKLTQDTSIAAASWTPIGTSSAPFTGTLDGNGKTVTWSGSAASQNYYGIFGFSSGTMSLPSRWNSSIFLETFMI